MSETRKQAEALDREYKALLIEITRAALHEYLAEDRRRVSDELRRAAAELDGAVASLRLDRKRFEELAESLRTRMDTVEARTTETAGIVCTLQSAVNAVSQYLQSLGESHLKILGQVRNESLSWLRAIHVKIDSSHADESKALGSLQRLVTERWRADDKARQEKGEKGRETERELFRELTFQTKLLAISLALNVVLLIAVLTAVMTWFLR